MAQLYLRKFRLLVETFRGTTIEVSNLRVTFNVSKMIQRAWQTAEITIYNLNKTTETDILQNGKTVTLEAGYQDGPYGVIYKGNIRQPIRGKEGAVTYFLKLVCITGDAEMNLGFCNFMMSNGKTARDIASEIARSSTVPFDINIGQLSEQQTTRGKAIFGDPGKHLRDIAINNNAGFYFNDGIAALGPLDQGPPDTMPVVNAKTGMISIPEQTDQGIRVRVLINPAMGLNSWFRIDNKSIIPAQLEFGEPQTLLDTDGVYRIIAIEASGDTRGNDWYLDLDAINQITNLPQMLAETNQNGM